MSMREIITLCRLRPPDSMYEALPHESDLILKQAQGNAPHLRFRKNQGIKPDAQFAKDIA